MEDRTLSGSDLMTGRVVFGTMTFGSQVDEDLARMMVDACLEAGVTMFDTANAYNGGRSEEILGTVPVVGGRRDEVLIATKVANPMGPGPEDVGLSKAAIAKAIDASLKRLQTDYVDLYYLHKPDWATPIEESLEALESLVQAGKVRNGASSNYAAWQMAEMLWLAERHGWQSLRIAQPMYNLLARRIEDEYAAFAACCDVSNIVYNPLCRRTADREAPARPAAPVGLALHAGCVPRSVLERGPVRGRRGRGGSLRRGLADAARRGTYLQSLTRQPARSASTPARRPSRNSLTSSP